MDRSYGSANYTLHIYNCCSEEVKEKLKELILLCDDLNIPSHHDLTLNPPPRKSVGIL